MKFFFPLFLLALNAQAADIDQLIANYSKAYQALNMAQLTLPYQENIRNLQAETDSAAQHALFERAQRDLKAIDASQASACQRLDLQRMAFEVETNLQKLAVLDKFGKTAVPDTGLYNTPMGREWYVYWLKRWLTMDITPEALKAFGQSETANAVARYRSLQAQMGYAGRDAEFAKHLLEDRYFYPGAETPKADYEARQAIVFKNLSKLFLPNAIAPALIAEANRGPNFPADAFYEPDVSTFFFNKSKPRYDKRLIDMLLLHESTPGHHYQNHYAAQRKLCESKLPYVFYSAFAEGWGAYVEEFGKELGVYQTPADELGAVEWDLVRSIRVVLDVGINYEGWSHQQALDYWHKTLPMLPALAEREINRVRNWPVQAITYKQGAAVFRQLRAEAQAKPYFDIRRFHDDMLKHGSLPLAVIAPANAISAYHAKLTPDFGSQTVKGTTTITIERATGQLSLPLNGMSIQAVRVDGQKAEYAATDRLTVTLPTKPTVKLEADYSAQPKQGWQWFGKGADQGFFTVFSSCHWMPCDEDPAHKAKVEYEVSLPDGMQFVASEGASASYLFGLAAGRFTKAGSAELPLYGAASKADLEAKFAESAAIKAFLQAKAGVPLSRPYAQVMVPVGAAQEMNSFSVIGKEEGAWAVVHEMAHQWWGNLITCQSWPDFWLNEGITTFMTAAWMQQRDGQTAYEAELATARKRHQFAIDSKFDKPLSYAGAYPDLRTRRAIAYSKGALFLDALRKELGEASFWAGLQRYTRDNAGRSVVSRDFQDAMEAQSGRSLASIFNAWVY